jgi:hypothetical protein
MDEPLTLWQELGNAASADPFVVVASCLFFLAILHTFIAPKFAALAHRIELAHAERIRSGSVAVSSEGKSADFRASILHFFGEVEAVFGLWAFILFSTLIFWPGKGWAFACAYIETASYDTAGKIVQGGVIPSEPSRYIEPLFVFVIMAMASSRPILSAANRLLGAVAQFLGGSPVVRWATVLTLAPLLGSLITEPAAMTIAALLISAQFKAYNPSIRLRYATLGLLFVNISIGGTLTNFAAPPVVMVAAKWQWSTLHMLNDFGLKALLAIVLSNLLYAFIFRNEFRQMAERVSEVPGTEKPDVIPFWVTLAHAGLMAWSVFMLMGHHPALLLAGFLGFLAFTVATPQWQAPISLRSPLLVAFFLASLVVHGGLQGWWISPVLVRLDEFSLFLGATFLTAFNDNAAITYLASQVPALSSGTEVARALQYAVLAGAVTGGGLTVIANAPNPAGQSILAPHFQDGVSPLRLALWALAPTTIAALCFLYLPHA